MEALTPEDYDALVSSRMEQIMTDARHAGILAATRGNAYAAGLCKQLYDLAEKLHIQIQMERRK